MVFPPIVWLTAFAMSLMLISMDPLLSAAVPFATSVVKLLFRDAVVELILKAVLLAAVNNKTLIIYICCSGFYPVSSAVTLTNKPPSQIREGE